MIAIDGADFTQKYWEAYSMRAFGEQDGDASLLWQAGALFFDLGMYAASARCRDRYYYLIERMQQNDEPLQVSRSSKIENGMVSNEG